MGRQMRLMFRVRAQLHEDNERRMAGMRQRNPGQEPLRSLAHRSTLSNTESRVQTTGETVASEELEIRRVARASRASESTMSAIGRQKEEVWRVDHG
eukprot:443247-Pleurochrysis_carterae.AAC.1